MKISFLGKEYKTKFDSGDKVYRVMTRLFTVICPKCKGNGYYHKNMDSDELETCSCCCGNGTKHINRYVVDTTPFTVKSINANIIEGNLNISYFVDGESPILCFKENELFKTLEEAESFCEVHNLKKKTIRIDDIVIPLHYLEFYPSYKKIKARLDEIKKHGKFINMIEVDLNNVLLDGYSTYVLAKGFGFKDIEVIERENICI